MTQPLSAYTAFRHVALRASERWRCAVYDRGFGMVVGLVELAGTPVSYDVEFERGGAAGVAAGPCRLRLS